MKIAWFELKSPIPPLMDFGSGRCFCAVLFCVFLLSGCHVLKGPGDEGDDLLPQKPAWNGDLVEGQENNPSIKAKFGVTLEGKDGVDAAFHELKAFIQNGGLEADPPVISTGDWIDLEAGLTVAAYNGLGGFEAVNSAVTPSSPPFDNYEGRTLRLIVVGINSFREGKGVGGQYAVTKNNGVDHVVFQFQNVPVKRRMNPSDTNVGGYAESEMRKYLVKVGGEAESGKFLTGLVAAGVPEDVLWAPGRYVVNGGNGATTANKINDILWLPTEREMFGYLIFSSATYETTGNQARLEYYNDYLRRIKYFENASQWYWEASPYSGDPASFCHVYASGYTTSYSASSAGGVAPAFCVR